MARKEWGLHASWYTIEDGPSLMNLMLAHYDRRPPNLRLLDFKLSNGLVNPCWLREAVITGSDIVEYRDSRQDKSLRIWHEKTGMKEPDQGAFLLRGWANEGYQQKIEGWYNPHTRKGVLEIKPKEEK